MSDIDDKKYMREYMHEYMKDDEHKKKSLELHKKYYQKKKEEIKKKRSDYYYNNKDVCQKRMESYRNRPENKEKQKEYMKNYWKEKKENLAPKNKQYYYDNSVALNKKAYQKKRIRYYSDVEFHLKEVISARMRGALRHNYKSKSTEELIGCTIPELRAHLEKQFKPGMTWDNHAITGWHIDHIVPCDTFDLSNLDQQKMCFHYTNLQPLWYEENIKKGVDNDSLIYPSDQVDVSEIQKIYS